MHATGNSTAFICIHRLTAKAISMFYKVSELIAIAVVYRLVYRKIC